jgi:hypothetical protein
MSLTDIAERVRHSLYVYLAELATVPSPEALATELNITRGRYLEALTELAETRHLVLKNGQVEMAHPFATRSFGFSVMGPNKLWWGGCAWDAFAIPHLVPGSPEVLIATTCPACGTPHAWVVTNQGPPAGEQVAHFLTPVAQVWPDAVHACESQLIFCSVDCVEKWLAATGNLRGYVMSMETLWRLAERWYAGRLDTPYIRREPTAAADYFRGVGVRGPFWGLVDEGDR